MSEAEKLMRREIYDLLDSKFQKIAMIAGTIYLRNRPDFSLDTIHRCIVEMCEKSEIEHQGDISDMRKGEIRLRQVSGSPIFQ